MYQDNGSLYGKVATVRVVKEIYERLTQNKEVSELEAAVILRVAAYVKQHPNASQDQLAAFLKQELASFSSAVENL